VTRLPRLCELRRAQTAQELRDFCTAAHIISPNEAEAVSMVRVAARVRKIASQSAHRALPLAQVGPAPPRELVARLAAAGARVVALRRGPEGAIVHWCAHVRFFASSCPGS
jgi:sugar/nucleoside kinase (ribokinase family)